MNRKILITGGSGMLGSSLRTIFPSADVLNGKQDLDLTNIQKTNEWFADDDNDFGNEQFVEGGSAIAPQWFDKDYVISESSLLNGIRLIRTDIMHRSNNMGNDNRRAVLSLRGDPNITYEEVAERVNGI